MSATRMTVTFDSDLADGVRAAAAKSGQSVSTWLTEIAGRRVRREALIDYLEEWQAEHGAFTPEELATADRDLGFDLAQR